ncbi:hypothetical protein ACBP83_13045 [Acinetobacter pseudolwoffii]|uniref:hypothetical protein n=1 Tax=Acinetobacter pseudolwoffii TaxID=2053287 RepID=UPI003524D1E7
MQIFIGGSQDGKDFPFDSEKYEGNTFKAAEINTNTSTNYRRHIVGEHTFWVDETIPNEAATYRIKKILEIH